jgi:hypothetical protein
VPRERQKRDKKKKKKLLFSLFSFFHNIYFSFGGLETVEKRTGSCHMWVSLALYWNSRCGFNVFMQKEK